jgi:hypothetical protein
MTNRVLRASRETQAGAGQGTPAVQAPRVSSVWYPRPGSLAGSDRSGTFTGSAVWLWPGQCHHRRNSRHWSRPVVGERGGCGVDHADSRQRAMLHEHGPCGPVQ